MDGRPRDTDAHGTQSFTDNGAQDIHAQPARDWTAPLCKERSP